MKKFLSIILLSVCSMVFAGCGNGQATNNNSGSAGDGSIEQTTENHVSSEEKSEDNKAGQKADSKEGIVVWFSRVGNTEFPDDVDATSSASLINDGGQLKGNAGVLAEWISEETGYDTFEIVTKNSYPVDYGETTEVAKDEQNADARPELTAQIEGSAEYKTVYLVFPNWWGDMPQALYSFFDEYDFSGKKLNVFVTHGGSGFSDTISTIKSLEPDAEVEEGLSVRDSDVPDSEKDVKNWVKEH
ncbi:MAG: hypothetical protein IJ733_06210 [Lachnospiraceae bacterium]|nr:hypothetical protein [Lachnospiraceae bacterium]